MPAEVVPVPTLTDVRAWTQITPTQLSDEQLQQILNAETSTQEQLCYTLLYDPALAQALLRRCARHIAARAVPLGLLDTGDYGPTALRRYDAEIDRLEGPWRIMVIG